MRRDDLIAKLKANADVIHSDGVGGLYLFGSHARDEATATSDVDLFFDRDPETGCVTRMTASMRISSGTSPTGICRI
ncbi:MAG: nucleotidyltransferase family protein [Hyphomicrobiaceae bacterium]